MTLETDGSRFGRQALQTEDDRTELGYTWVTIMYRTATWVVLGLISGNFGYQALTSGNWAIASERSTFQLFAVVGLVIALGRMRARSN